MKEEAEITINGTRLTDNEAMVVRLALATFADIMANQLGFKDDGIALTDRYMTSVSRIQMLLERPQERKQ
jgi:hypothetical protein